MGSLPKGTVIKRLIDWDETCARILLRLAKGDLPKCKKWCPVHGIGLILWTIASMSFETAMPWHIHKNNKSLASLRSGDPLSELVANNIWLMQNLYLWRWWNSTVRYFLIHTHVCGLQSWWPLCENQRKFYEWELDGVSTNSAGRAWRLYPILERHGDRFEQAARPNQMSYRGGYCVLRWHPSTEDLVIR